MPFVKGNVRNDGGGGGGGGGREKFKTMDRTQKIVVEIVPTTTSLSRSIVWYLQK